MKNDVRKSNVRRKKKVRWNPVKFIENMMCLFGILVMIWFLISYIQILAHQGDWISKGIHYTYPNWNMFIWVNNLPIFNH